MVSGGSDSDDEDFGPPMLPPRQQPTVSKKDTSNDDDDGDFGPPVPPPSVPAPAPPPAASDDSLPAKRAKADELSADLLKTLRAQLPTGSRYERSYSVPTADIVAVEVFPQAEGMILGVCSDGVGRWWRKLTTGAMFQAEQRLFDGNLCAAFLSEHSSTPQSAAAAREAMFRIAAPPTAASSSSQPRCAVFCMPAWRIKVVNVAGMLTERTLMLPFAKPEGGWVLSAMVPTIAIVFGGPQARESVLFVSASHTTEVSLTPLDDGGDGGAGGEADGSVRLRPLRRGATINPIAFIAQNAASKVVVSVDAKGLLDYVDPCVASSTAVSCAWEPILSNNRKRGGTAMAEKEIKFAKRLATDLFAISNCDGRPLSFAMGAEYFAVGYIAAGAAKIAIFHLATGSLRHTLATSRGTETPLSIAAVKTIAFDARVDALAFFDCAAGIELFHAPSGQFLLPAERLMLSEDIKDGVVDAVGHLGHLRFLQISVASSQKLRNIISSMPLSVSGRSIASFLEGAGELDPLLFFVGAAPKPSQLAADGDSGAVIERSVEAASTSATRSVLFCVSRRRPIANRDWECQLGDTIPAAATNATDEPPIPAQYRLPEGTTVEMRVKGFGRVALKLFTAAAPLASYNFVTLANGGYYDALTFHRVIRGFMIQGGCPKGDGTGGRSAFPDGKDFDDENLGAKIDRPMLLCMANRGPKTNGSQFFITTAAAPWLSGKHTVFGEVVAGAEVVRAIESVAVGADDKPASEVVIEQIRTL